MAWFGGSVDEAVKLCKQRSGLLTIFVRDTTTDSQRLEGIFSEPDVAAIVTAKQPDILLLNITQGTANFDMLNSVYPLPSIPMIQFIDGSNGLLLFSVKPSNKDDIVKGLNDGIDTWMRQRPASRVSTTNLGRADATGSTSATVTMVRDDDSAPVSDSSSDLQARVARVQERAAQIREQKERDAERLKREQEIQRRKDGQLMADAERTRQAHLADQIRLDLEKERKAEADHRQRVLEGLRQDKEDRERRQRETRDLSSSFNPTPSVSPPTASGSALSPGTDYSKSKIQFRHEEPGGVRTFVGDFAAEDNFHRVMEFVRKETGLRGGLVLRQLYPRRDFSEGEGKSSLKDLGLVPNAVLLIIPANSGRTGLSSSSPGVFSLILTNVWKLLRLPVQGFNTLLGYVFPRPQIQNPTSRPTSYSAATRSTASTSSSDRPNSNIHRRRPADDDPTYNGNSTQQL